MGFEALINKLRLTISKVDGGIELVLAGSDVECIGLNKVIRAGQISGLREIMTIETAEGPVFRARFAAKIFEPDHRENYTWNIRGVPDIHLQQNDVPSVEITCASIVNRIPDVLNAEPGFITAEKLDTPFYRTSSLENYVD
jgi:4-hydroxy-tetrahydrodipicolinate reductase